MPHSTPPPPGPPPPGLTPGLTLVLGGARSGKSTFAESLFDDIAEPIYLATGEGRDAEMRERIAAHRERRGSRWHCLEEPRDLAGALHRTARADTGILVDCMTLWLSNLMEAGRDLPAEFDRLTDTLADLPGRIVLVTNEVGQGIVPDNALARAFRDQAGILNQILARRCQRVVLMAAGLPLVLKSNPGTGQGSPHPTLTEE